MFKIYPEFPRSDLDVDGVTGQQHHHHQKPRAQAVVFGSLPSLGVEAKRTVPL